MSVVRLLLRLRLGRGIQQGPLRGGLFLVVGIGRGGGLESVLCTRQSPELHSLCIRSFNIIGARRL